VWSAALLSELSAAFRSDYLTAMFATDLSIIWNLRLTAARGGIRSAWEANRLRVAAGLLTMIVLVAGMYLLFRYLFAYLTGIEGGSYAFGETLAGRLLTMSLMAFGVFIAVSSLISGVSVLFRSGETEMLLALPVDSRAVATAGTLESWFHAGWAMLIMGVPLITAFCLSLRSAVPALVAGLLLLPVLMITWLSMGTIIMSLLTRTGGGKIWKFAGGVAILAATGAILFLSSSSPTELVIDESNVTLGRLHTFVSQLPGSGESWWPHSLFTAAVSRFSRGATEAGILRAIILLLEAGITGFGALYLVSRKFRIIRSMAAEASSDREIQLPLLRRGGRTSTIFQKDVILFGRDPVQWSQLGLLAGMFIVYAANLRRFPIDFSDPVWLSVAIFMNISFSGFVAATLLVRFAFPSISMEGPGLHTILQLSEGRKLLFWSKWTQSFFAILPLMLGVVLFSASSLGAGTVLMSESGGAIFFICFVLVSINISLGSIFPNFGAKSTATVASGQGGIISAFASMGYVLFMVSVLSIITRRYLTDGFRESVLVGPLLYSLLVVLPVAVSVSITAVRFALRSLERRDF
jgi:ABC-2 type transport system permease protein